MRFYYNRQAQKPMKMSKELSFPAILDLSEYYKNDVCYELFGVGVWIGCNE